MGHRRFSVNHRQLSMDHTMDHHVLMAAGTNPKVRQAHPSTLGSYLTSRSRSCLSGSTSPGGSQLKLLPFLILPSNLSDQRNILSVRALSSSAPLLRRSAELDLK